MKYGQVTEVDKSTWQANVKKKKKKTHCDQSPEQPVRQKT